MFRIAVLPAFVGTVASRGPRGGSDEQGSYSGCSITVRRGIYPRVSWCLGQSRGAMRSQDRNRALAVSVLCRRSTEEAAARLSATSATRYRRQLSDHSTEFRTILCEQAARHVTIRCRARARQMGTVEGSCEIP